MKQSQLLDRTAKAILTQLMRRTTSGSFSYYLHDNRNHANIPPIVEFSPDVLSENLKNHLLLPPPKRTSNPWDLGRWKFMWCDWESWRSASFIFSAIHLRGSSIANVSHEVIARLGTTYKFLRYLRRHFRCGIRLRSRCFFVAASILCCTLPNLPQYKSTPFHS